MRRIKLICVGLFICFIWMITQWRNLSTKFSLVVPSNRRETFANSIRYTGTAPDIGSTDLDKISCTRCNHFVFIKVHKCGSQTVTDMLFRVGMSNNLTFVLPKEAWHISLDQHKNWTKIIPLPPGKSFDALIMHAIYDRPVMDKIMPGDTTYVGIVRNPLEQTNSAIHYFYYEKIPGDNKLSTYLSNHVNFTQYQRWFINSMSYDFGLEKNCFYNETKINEHLETLDKELKLIMVMERMAESLILLKRYLCWEIEDILFISQNINKKKPAINVTETEKTTHAHLAMADYMLYQFSVQRLQRQIDLQGQDFWEELSIYNTILKKMNEYCHGDKDQGRTFIIPETKWNDVITLSRERCKYMATGGIRMIEVAKKYQYPELTREEVKIDLHKRFEIGEMEHIGEPI